jgi:hypothetical protein
MSSAPDNAETGKVEVSTTMFYQTPLSQRIIGNFIRQAEFHFAS